MRTAVLDRIVGSFLQIYSAILLVPVSVGIYYSEPFFNLSGFLVASGLAFFLGTLLSYGGNLKKPTVIEGITATVLGWVMAIILGAIPLLVELSVINALFEATAGLTTTGISMALQPQEMANSLLFWRSFMQWLGGIGILTFFIVVLRESGGVARKLYSAESHKTESGSIRPSLAKSIVDLWKVYGVLTVLFGLIFFYLGMSTFESIIHVFSGISTGGFSTHAESIAFFNSVQIEIVTILLMLMGGMNFVLIYGMMKLDFRSTVKNSEFRWYIGAFLLVTGLVFAELVSNGLGFSDALLDAAFQTAAIFSSTGYSTMALGSLSIFLQTLFIGIMFVGGSLGSTSGGWKMFRLRTMYETLKVRLRSYRLPSSAINRPVIDKKLIDDEMVRTISLLFFTWILLIFLAVLVVMFFDDLSLMAALSGSVSSAGNMGPVYMPAEEMVELSVPSKLAWIFLMIAGRLEMLPVLAIFNRELFKDSK